MKTSPIYLKSLKLSNIKTFGENAELELQNSRGYIPNWTLILGDNGIGKSTLLHSIAWMKPNTPDPGAPGMDLTKEDIEPTINNEENEVLLELVRRKGSNKAKLEALFVANRKINQKENIKKESECSTKMLIQLNDSKMLELVVPEFDTTNEELFLNQEVEIFAYSASRSLGKLNLDKPELEDTIPDFINEKTELYDADEILHTANYAMFGSKASERKKYKRYLDSVINMLMGVLPEDESITGIHIDPPKLIKNKLRKLEVTITTRHGDNIPFSSFSLGYQTVATMAVDLSWRLFNRYSTSSNPLKEPAIVLIDEIDLHLHPKWQRDIMKNLSKHFPAVQFIATAHSPLMVQAAIRSNHAILMFDEDESAVKIENNPKNIDGWRIDQILTSEFFGLPSSRGVEYEKLLREHDILKSLKSLNKKQQNDLARIEKKLFNLPTAEKSEEIENRKLVNELIEKIKKTKKEIKL